MYESDFAAAQAFLLSAKHVWTTTLYRDLREQYDSLVQGDGVVAVPPDDAVRKIEGTTSYRFFAWLERHLQRMKYTSRYGVVPYHSQRSEQLLQEAGFGVDDIYSPDVDPDLELPKYYRSMDVHQHQGGLWSDMTAGFAYEYGARTTTPLLGETHEDLHNRFTEMVANGGEFANILDLGCGFGKSTRPFVARFPNARIEAVDLAAPCLHVAAYFAREDSTRNVRYSQQDARHTKFDDECFDLVTSTMVLHEMPVRSVVRLFTECFRLLQPGGRMAHLDFYVLPDAFDRFMHYGHSIRNNEIFMRGVVELDLPAELERIGFTDIRIEPFQESANVDLSRHDAWRFPWTSICATKPA